MGREAAERVQVSCSGLRPEVSYFHIVGLLARYMKWYMKHFFSSVNALVNFIQSSPALADTL